MAKRNRDTTFDDIPAADRKAVIALHTLGVERARNGQPLSPQKIYQRLIEARTELGVAITKPALAESDGRALAAAMLRELESCDGDECAIDHSVREGRPQNNVVLRYIEQLRLADNRALDSGFSSVLTDFITICYRGGVTDVEFYEPEREDRGNKLQ